MLNWKLFAIIIVVDDDEIGSRRDGGVDSGIGITDENFVLQ